MPSPSTAIEALHAAVLVSMCVLVSTLPAQARVPLTAWFAMLMALTLAVPGLVAKLGEWVRFVTAGLVLLSVYEALGGIIDALGAPLQDALAMSADRWLTHGHIPPLTIWPLPAAVVDAFAVAYATYFTLPIVLVALLLRKGDIGGARSSALTMLLAFYLHYIVYIFLPVVGPLRSGEPLAVVRAALVAEGGSITHLLRVFIAAAEKTPQDGFPSAHTSVASLVAALAWRHRLRSWPMFVGMAMAVTSSTIVLGYHYLIDLIAAWPMAWIAWRLARGIAIPCHLDRNFGRASLVHPSDQASGRNDDDCPNTWDCLCPCPVRCADLRRRDQEYRQDACAERRRGGHAGCAQRLDSGPYLGPLRNRDSRADRGGWNIG